jgi:hypothetical protein
MHRLDSALLLKSCVLLDLETISPKLFRYEDLNLLRGDLTTIENTNPCLSKTLVSLK